MSLADHVTVNIEKASRIGAPAPTNEPEFPVTGSLSDFTGTPAEVAALMAHVLGLPSASPSHLWKFNDAAGATDYVGAHNLVDSGTPAKEVVHPDFDQTLTGFTLSSTDYTGATSSSIANPGSANFAAVWVGEIGSVHVNGRTLFGKRDPGGIFQGWEVISRPAGLRFNHLSDAGGGGGTLYTADVDVAFNVGYPTVVIPFVDYTNNLAGLITSLGSTITAAPAVGSASNAVNMQVGAQRTNSLEFDVALLSYLEGAAASGLAESNAISVRDWFQLPATP